MARAATKKRSKGNAARKSASARAVSRRSARQRAAASENSAIGPRLRELFAVVIFITAIFCAIALFSKLNQESPNRVGWVGELTSEVLSFGLGVSSFLLVGSLFALSVALLLTRQLAARPGWSSLVAWALMIGSCSTAAAAAFGRPAGGALGTYFAASLVRNFNFAGALLFCGAVFVLAFSAFTRVSCYSFLKGIFSVLRSLARFSFGLIRWALPRGQRELPAPQVLDSSAFSSAVEREDDVEQKDDLLSQTPAEPLKILRRVRPSDKAAKKGPGAGSKNGQPTVTSLRAKPFESPALSLLVATDTKVAIGPNDETLVANSQRLEEALRNFRIGGRVVEVHPGPVITLYQFSPAAGVKVQRIINLSDDLALALKVASVRVYAPVPGKGTVGIEVPNAQREMVRLRDCLESEEFQQGTTALPLALGKDTYGNCYVANLPRMPHLLIAGATGTGKSVCINSLLLSLLYRHSPAELRLLLIDPKMLELSVYEDIPHLMAPVVTNAKRARGVLWWAVEEMERRYRLLKDVGVRDLEAYNRLVSEDKIKKDGNSVLQKRKQATIELQERDVVVRETDDSGSSLRKGLGFSGEEEDVLPRIVVVVDELADLMLSVGREIEELLTRLAQKARAAGIHLILATQRPSVNVITGLIKANFPARISFKVASKIDARTVMDTSGAEKLLGQGDMLFLAPYIGQVKRMHSPFVSDQEVHDVVEWLRAQGAPQYDKAIEEMISRLNESEGGGGMSSEGGFGDYDEFYDSAVSLVIEKGQASTSMVQRAFRIGYNRAARILEVMEREGIVGPADGSKPRQVLVGSIDGA